MCRELALLLHAGVRAGDGLALLAEEEPEAQRRKQLEEMARQVDDGASLGEALAGQGLFPAYVTGLVTVGERSGRTEEALNALSVYYEQRDQLDLSLIHISFAMQRRWSPFFIFFGFLFDRLYCRYFFCPGQELHV